MSNYHYNRDDYVPMRFRPYRSRYPYPASYQYIQTAVDPYYGGFQHRFPPGPRMYFPPPPYVRPVMGAGAPFRFNGHARSRPRRSVTKQSKPDVEASISVAADNSSKNGEKDGPTMAKDIDEQLSDSEYASDDGEELVGSARSSAPAPSTPNQQTLGVSNIVVGNISTEERSGLKRKQVDVSSDDVSGKRPVNGDWMPAADVPPVERQIKKPDLVVDKAAAKMASNSEPGDITKTAESSVGEKTIAPDKMKSLISDSKCMVCAVEFTSAVQRQQHLEGRKHQRRLKFLAEHGAAGIVSTDENGGQPGSELDPLQSSKTPSVEDTDDDPDVAMDEFDDHSAFEEGLVFLRSICKAQEDQNKLTQCAFELFRMMEDYLRFLTKKYVSPGLDPRRMSWNELLNVLKRNTVNRLSSGFDRKLDSVRQLRNSVVHSFSMSLSEDGLNKIFSIADDLLNWGRGFRAAAAHSMDDGTAPRIYEGLQQKQRH